MLWSIEKLFGELKSSSSHSYLRTSGKLLDPVSYQADSTEFAFVPVRP